MAIYSLTVTCFYSAREHHKDKTVRDTLAFLQQAMRLKVIPRIGWAMRGVPLPESVADHTYGVLMVAGALLEEIEETVDQEGVLIMALLHDLAECVLGDLPKPAQRFFPQNAKRTAESGIHHDLFELLPSPARWSALLEEYSKGQTAASRLVHDADRLDMLLQARAYEQAGHRGLDEFWQKAESYHWSFAASDRLYHAIALERNETR